MEQSRLLTEMDAVAAMTERIVAENKVATMDQEEYQRRRNELVARYEAARDGQIHRLPMQGSRPQN